MLVNTFKLPGLLFILFYVVNISAQSSFDKLIEKQDYEKMYKKISKKMEKEPADVMNNFDFSFFFNSIQNPHFNCDSAYYFAKRAEDFFGKSDQKEKDKLAKDDLILDSIHLQVLKVCKTAFSVAKEKNIIETYNYFIDHFPDSEKEIAMAIIYRDSIAFHIAREINTINAYQNFINTYPLSIEKEQAVELRNTLAFEIAVAKNSVESFQNFIETYPNAKEKDKAVVMRDKAALFTAQKINTSTAFKIFMKNYPKSHLFECANYKCDSLYYLEATIRNDAQSHIKFLDNNKNNKYIKTLQDSLYFISKNNLDFYGLKYYIENIQGNRLDSAWLYYYKIYTMDGYPVSYVKFKQLYENDFPYIELLDSNYNTALSIINYIDKNGFNMNKTDEFKEYLKKASNKYIAFQILQFIIEKDIKTKNWPAALKNLQSYGAYFGPNHKYFNNLVSILSESDKSIKTVSIGSSINTYKGGEYVPVITADNKNLYFCGRKRSDNFNGEDVFVSNFKNGSWQNPKLIKELSKEGNDAPLSVSSDGNEMLLFVNGDIYFSQKTITGWSEIEAFPEPINTESWEADAMMTSDGKALIFVSRREGGHNYLREDADIYVCPKIGDSWGEAINLGPTINTPFTDRSPFLHPDMKTLYFASSGHGGLGSVDLFKSTRLNDSSWTNWSEPINMGKEINSEKEDWGYRISTDGEKAYFSAMESNGENDIHTMNIPVHLRPDAVATITGKLVDRNNNPVEATIKWEDLAAQKVVGESKSNPVDGSYFIVLPLGKMYGYYIDKADYFPISNNIDLRKENRAIEVNTDIVMPTFEQMKKEDLTVPVNNLFFGVNRADLLSESFPELLRVANIIKKHNVKVQIAGHTDNTGTLTNNLELSKKRAEAVKNFLLKKGVRDELIETVGFGDTQPIAGNDTEEGKARNRRVEMKFVD